jgi:hypothetical protein
VVVGRVILADVKERKRGVHLEVRGAVPESAAPPGTQKEKEFYSAVPTQQLTP